MLAAALAKCERLSDVGDREVTVGEVTSLVSACSAALSSPEVASDFFSAIKGMCEYSNEAEANVVTCGTAGVIPLFVASMSAHGTAGGDVQVARSGCSALAALVHNNAVNADAIVLATGGLDVILSAMASHRKDILVQFDACTALLVLAKAGSPAARRVMRASSVKELLNAAKKNHPPYSTLALWVQEVADDTLAALRA